MVGPEIVGLRGMAPGEPAAEDADTARARIRVFAALMGEAAPARIGRYTLLHRIGTGGMGVVWAAFDPELDRTIALKVLHQGRGDAGSRLLREARAMAKLNHPNVAAIYDVGVHGDELYLAMELVHGETLHRWLTETRAARRPSEVLGVYAQAGRGLAAAHALGIVHRDFKPANAIVGRDGRVRVVDFGLARRDENGALLTTDHDEPSHEDALGDAAKTPSSRSGAAIGTPAYMAPEQILARPMDARTDQFAFCVALWEAMFGERPFAGVTPSELFTSVVSGKLRECPRPRGVPTSVVDVLRRGLALRPEDRHPSMNVLLERLERGVSRARRCRALLALGVVGMIAIAVWSWGRFVESRRAAQCVRDGEAFASVWNERREAAVREAFAATAVPYAADSADRTVSWLATYSDALRVASTDACLDANVHARWDATTFERSMWCLEERRAQLDTTLTQLALADAQVVRGAIAMAAGLTAVAPCRDPDVLDRLPLPPAEDRDDVRTIHLELVASAASRRVGRVEDGVADIPELLARADATRWSPLSAAARLDAGIAFAKAWRHEDAEAMLHDAYFLAVNAGAPEIAARSATVLTWTVGYKLGRHREGLTWGRHAEAALTELGSLDGPLAAKLFENQCIVQRVAAPLEEARAACARALDAKERTLGPDHPHVSGPLDLLAMVESDLGNHATARELQERSVRIAEASYGAHHPAYAEALGGWAHVFENEGRHAESVEVIARSLAIDEAAFGHDSIRLFPALENLAYHQRLAGDCPAAAQSQQRLLDLVESSGSRDARLRGVVMSTLAGYEACVGNDEKALPLQERAVELLREGLGENSREVAQGMISLGGYQRARGARAQARATLERAVAILDEIGAGNGPLAASPVRQLAEIALDAGRSADAVRLATRAVALGTRPRENLSWVEPQGVAVAETRFVLARAHWEHGDHAVALGIGLAARDGFAAVPGYEQELAAVDAWLRAHSGTLRGHPRTR